MVFVAESKLVIQNINEAKTSSLELHNVLKIFALYAHGTSFNAPCVPEFQEFW